MSKIKQTTFKLGGLVALLAIIFTIVVPMTRGRVKPYYQGDAINYQGRLLVASTNMDRLQLMEVSNSEIKILSELSPDRSGYLAGDDFYNCAFYQASGSLYLYAVNGRYLYKYNISNPSQPELIDRVKDNSWDWFRSVLVFNNRLVTVGTKGVKIWNTDLQVIDNLAIILDNPFNYTLSQDFLMAIDGQQLRYYNLMDRQWVRSVNLTINDPRSNRQIYNDQLGSSVLVADDWALKQFDFQGNLINSFKFTANNGYDVLMSSDRQKVYLSDGIGVVRLNRANLQPEDWIYVQEMKASDAWAMGLRLVNWQGSDHLVIFNNGSVTCLNNRLGVVANFYSTETQPVDQLTIFEPLNLSVDKNRSTVGGQVSLQGAGFDANELLEIKFLSNQSIVYQVTTDSLGHFQKTVTVPEITVSTGQDGGLWPTDIRVVGLNSQKTYSISFQIEY